MEISTRDTSKCLQHCGAKEPIFVLRAQDILAPQLVREWARLLKIRAGAGLESAELSRRMLAKAQEAEKLACVMEDWPKRKYPD